jgi:hypothetical protein
MRALAARFGLLCSDFISPNARIAFQERAVLNSIERRHAAAGHGDLAKAKGCCYDPRFGARAMPAPIPAMGDRLMVGLQTLTLPV